MTVESFGLDEGTTTMPPRTQTEDRQSESQNLEKGSKIIKEDIIDAFERGFSGVLYFILILANLWLIITGMLLIWFFRTNMFGKLKRKTAS